MVVTGPKPVICVLEDDEAVRDSLGLMLGRNEYAATTFDSPNDFLLAKDMDRYTCLVVDFQLPGMNGLELLELLRLRAYSKPAIVIGAGGEPRLTDRMRKAGVSDILRKPIAPETLLHAIRSAIDGKSLSSAQLRTQRPLRLRSYS